MRLLDAGTTWAKVLEDGELRVLRTEALPADFCADIATGHNASRWSGRVVNELIALARGGMALIEDEEFFLADVGARDLKVVHMAGGRLVHVDWNDSCGALCGFSAELLALHFHLDWSRLEASDTGLHITCGIFAFSDLFDQIAGGVKVERAASMFVKGLVDLTLRFAGHPKVLYLSGGMCENPLFLASFDTEIRPLGRGVLIEGLKQSNPDL